MADTGMSDPLSRRYRQLEKRFTPEPQPDYERLVVALDNVDEPLHRWFRMKEAFSPALWPRLLKDLRLDGESTLAVGDPFAGSGTTLVSALQWAGESSARSVSAVGSEVNPFLHLLSAAKVAVATLPDEVRGATANDLSDAAVAVLEYRGNPSALPPLSALQNRDYFPHAQMHALLTLRAGIDSQSVGDLQRSLLQVALASVIEPASRLRRDGRALRYVSDKVPGEVQRLFARAIQRMAADIRLTTCGGTGNVALSDGRRPLASITTKLDVALFSPPYPNNIDYTEVYKIEAWLLGLIDSQDGFRQQRLATMRSHPSIRWGSVDDGLPKEVGQHVDRLIRPLLAAVPEGRYEVGRREVIRGYVRDAAAVFLHLRDEVKNGGHVVFVVGNSHHGNADASVTIAADLLLADVAEASGFEVERFFEARRLRRRGEDKLLRESVVILRRAS